MPRCVSASRIAEAGGDVSELERGLDSSQILLAPTLAVQQGRTNPSVRYVWGAFSCVCMYLFVCVCVCVCVWVCDNIVCVCACVCCGVQ